MTTPDVIGLLALCLAFIGFVAWVVYVDRVLGDPDHPDHEIAKEAIKESETRSTLDHWFRYD